MLTIPAIDIFLRKVTRLHQGDFSQAKFYNQTPLEYAKSFDSIGAKWLHVVDLAASKSGRISVEDQILGIKDATKLKLEFGGGIKSFSNAQIVFDLGVDRIVIGSISVTNKKEFELILAKYGPEKIVVATDSKDEMILTKGWTEKSKVSLWQHLDYCTSIGVTYFLCTDISKDGTLEGPNTALYKKIMKIHPKIKMIASGGISCADDLRKLSETKVYATVVGRAIYENKITLEELKKFVS